MNKLKILFLLIFFLSSSQVFALEQSSSVKVSTVFKAQSSWDGKPIEYPTGRAEVTGMVIEIAPGGETGWHLHPVPSFGMMLEGETEVQLKNGNIKHLKAGETIAEVVNTYHNGRNIGAVPAKLIVFYTGSVGQKLSEKESDK